MWGLFSCASVPGPPFVLPFTLFLCYFWVHFTYAKIKFTTKVKRWSLLGAPTSSLSPPRGTCFHRVGWKCILSGGWGTHKQNTSSYPIAPAICHMPDTIILWFTFQLTINFPHFEFSHIIKIQFLDQTKHFNHTLKIDGIQRQIYEKRILLQSILQIASLCSQLSH